MTEAERCLYAEAGAIMVIAMGKTRATRGYRPEWQADIDPLAYWCGVEAIVALAKTWRSRRALATVQDKEGQ